MLNTGKQEHVLLMPFLNEVQHGLFRVNISTLSSLLALARVLQAQRGSGPFTGKLQGIR